jgi:toxin ParE1/3/4
LSGYKLTPRARADIEQIWDYTLSRWGVDQADKYLRQIAEAMALVGGDPARGRACDEVRAGYRKYAAGAHVLFYRPTQNGVTVVRILHQRMDFQRHL